LRGATVSDSDSTSGADPAAAYQQPDLALLGEDHVRSYRETNGEVGYLWNGVTTTGRRSGLARTTPLIFSRDGDDYLVVASMGGAPQHPNWYVNLTANPEAEIQVLDANVPVVARTASEEEKPRVWSIVSAQWPNYDVYQSRTTRVIPVVVLSPRSG
jgi:deazaflavin-dependent oxidoreductase (nitroreductase family)